MKKQSLHPQYSSIQIGQVCISPDHPLTLISGPCVIESKSHAIETAHALKTICESIGIQLIYKSSYDKANRSSIDSFRGPGLKHGLDILHTVKETFQLPICTDIHLPEQALPVSEVADVIQIPAFLCRQTDLLVAAAQTSATINIKKGQFLAPWDMKNVVEKLTSTGHQNLILTERGTTFGYNNLVSDMRSIPILKQFGFPVCFDASHSIQLPGGSGTHSGGQREFIPPLTRAALAAGADLLFIESHPSPQHAKSDAKSVMAFQDLQLLLKDAKALHQLIQNQLTPSS